MRYRTPKRAAQERIYRDRAKAFLAEHEWCEFPLGCGRTSTEVHHRNGREGWRLLVEDWWSASCHEHNQFAETHTGEALAIGWLMRMGDAA